MSENAPKPKSGRGGKRPGAGRKKKGSAPASALSELDKKAALAAPLPDEIESHAQRRDRDVLDMFVKQLLHGEGETARISASLAILDRTFGKPTAEAGGDAMLPFFGTAPARKAPTTSLQEAARPYAILAIETLAKIATCGVSETARVAAGRALWDRGHGTAPPAKIPDEFTRRTPLGKKEEAAMAADAAATGRYATPAPPPRQVSGTIQ